MLRIVLFMLLIFVFSIGVADAQGTREFNLRPMQSHWTKICGFDRAKNIEACYTTRNFGLDRRKKPSLDIAVYDIQGRDARIVRFLLPVGLRTDQGVAFSIDGGALGSGSFKICFPNGCFAEARVGEPVIDAMKRGGEMQVAVRDQSNKAVVFDVPLAGFGATFDGAGTRYRARPSRRQ